MPRISARNTANILHAMAKLHLDGEQSHNLADLLVRRAMQTVSDLRPREASMLMHGLANRGVKSRAISHLFRGVQPQLVQKAGECDAQTIANAVWALAAGARPKP